MSISRASFVVAILLAALASCTLAPDHCLHMSDCSDGTTCVEGLCVGGDPPPAETLSTQADASSLPKPVTTTPVTPTDASMTDGHASDASHTNDASQATDASDGALTDAASDG